ncbi:GerMN domain-containing protein [Paenibacillus piri]|uniref:GerMN domain-containing protein n=1 Tax=Paenibacillus piri TaxID=2547395 RepID=A0A4R5KX69_9BACL|nr:GerMN domain-containing protein [Paenibacillus piri]TDG00173.1 hypothetical protein E1757_00550 [Paenibacillus piri]
MHKHTIRSLIIIGVVALALSGCGQKPTDSGPASQGSTPPANGGQTAPPDQKPPAEKEAVSLPIKAYFGDEQATKLVEKEVTISYKDEKDKYMAALQALKNVPQDGKLVPLAGALGFKSAELKDKKLNVDLTVSGEGRLGAPGEKMLLDAIRQTLFQFKEVDAIDILVDGKPAESLMGHMDLPHPIKREQP